MMKATTTANSSNNNSNNNNQQRQQQQQQRGREIIRTSPLVKPTSTTTLDVGTALGVAALTHRLTEPPRWATPPEHGGSRLRPTRTERTSRAFQTQLRTRPLHGRSTLNQFLDVEISVGFRIDCFCSDTFRVIFDMKQASGTWGSYFRYR